MTTALRYLLRLEALAALGAMLIAYHVSDARWGMLLLMFFLPDISMLAYFAGPRWGAHAYNAAHTYVLPALLAAALHVADLPLAVPIIWAAHIAFDRALGYGLKLPTGFHDTHLGELAAPRR